MTMWNQNQQGPMTCEDQDRQGRQERNPQVVSLCDADIERIAQAVVRLMKAEGQK